MSKLRLAKKLAEATGASLQRSLRYVEDVGASRTKSTLRSLDAGGKQVVRDWWKPATAGTGLVGGGAIVWRQQDVAKAQAIAEKEQSHAETIKAIMESDLSPEKKAELTEQANEATKNNDGGDDDEGDGNPFSDLFGDGIEGLLIKLVIVMMVVGFVMSYASSSMPTPSVSAGFGGGR